MRELPSTEALSSKPVVFIMLDINSGAVINPLMLIDTGTAIDSQRGCLLRNAAGSCVNAGGKEFNPTMWDKSNLRGGSVAERYVSDGIEAAYAYGISQGQIDLYNENYWYPSGIHYLHTLLCGRYVEFVSSEGFLLNPDGTLYHESGRPGIYYDASAHEIPPNGVPVEFTKKVREKCRNDFIAYGLVNLKNWPDAIINGTTLNSEGFLHTDREMEFPSAALAANEKIEVNPETGIPFVWRYDTQGVLRRYEATVQGGELLYIKKERILVPHKTKNGNNDVGFSLVVYESGDGKMQFRSNTVLNRANGTFLAWRGRKWVSVTIGGDEVSIYRRSFRNTEHNIYIDFYTDLYSNIYVDRK